MDNDITANQNRGPEVLAVTTALFVAATFAVILRFISRLGIVKRISADDYAMILAWVSRGPCLHLISQGFIDILAHCFRNHLRHLLWNVSGLGKT